MCVCQLWRALAFSPGPASPLGRESALVLTRLSRDSEVCPQAAGDPRSPRRLSGHTRLKFLWGGGGGWGSLFVFDRFPRLQVQESLANVPVGSGGDGPARAMVALLSIKERLVDQRRIRPATGSSTPDQLQVRWPRVDRPGPVKSIFSRSLFQLVEGWRP